MKTHLSLQKACPSKNFNIEKCWDSVVFALIFQKNIEKVWDIEKFCNIAIFRKKIKAKATESHYFSMSKFLDGQAFCKLR